MPRTVPNAFTRTNFAEQNLRGFTLVELLVVITIMALMGAYTLSNYGPFGEDQKLKNAVLDIQSQLRTAQTNATTHTLCFNEPSVAWYTYLQGGSNNPTPQVFPVCEQPNGNLKGGVIQKLNNNIRLTVSGNNLSCPVPVNNAFPFLLRIKLHSNGKIAFLSSTKVNGVYIEKTDCGLLTITLKNNKTGNTKSLIIEQGGRIYAQ